MIRLKIIALVALLAGTLALGGCGSGAAGGILVGYALDELFGTETSTISVDNVAGVLYLLPDEQFQLRILHRQLRDDGYGYGRYYYEEYVTDECEYKSSAPDVAYVLGDGLVVAVGPGTAVISVKFDLVLQKADQTRLTVVVE